MEQFKRSLMLLGEEKLNKLQNAHVLVVGIGGVGGYAAEFLARTGVGKLTIIDQDVIDSTNLNRQIIALNSTLNMPKVDAMKNRLLDINQNIQVNAIYQQLSADNAEILLGGGYDYIVDAIDSVKDKTDLILTANKLNIPIISALGTGNRLGIPSFSVKDIYKTTDDGLAKVLRKQLREKGIKSLEVVISDQKPCDLVVKYENERNIGSMVHFPAMCACVIVGHLIEKLTNWLICLWKRKLCIIIKNKVNYGKKYNIKRSKNWRS